MDTPLNIGELTFIEKINLTKLQYIVNNPSKYEAIIEAQEKDMRRHDKNYNAYAVFQKIINNSFKPAFLEGTEYAYLKVSYKKGSNCDNIGRWYCNKGIGLQPLCVSVRHTICDGIWVDVDQVNSHPNIFYTFMKKYGFHSELLQECINDRDNFLKKVSKDRDTAKTMVIATINGAKYKKNLVLVELYKQIKPCIQHVINLPEYGYILEHVQKTYPDDKNIEGKTISRILQVIENNLLECYVNFFNERGYLKDDQEPHHQIALIFDGFQLLSKKQVSDELLNQCRLHALSITGYDIPLKIKPFDNKLELPPNYADCADDLPGLLNKFRVGLNFFVEQHESLFKKAVHSDGGHKPVAEIAAALFKDTNVYDGHTEKWYYCNVQNIWKETNEPLILKGLLNIVQEAFEIYSRLIWNKIMDDKTLSDEQKDTLKEHSKAALKTSNKLNNSTFLSSVLKFKELYLKDKFLETHIDRKAYLFAFSNKVLDLTTNTVRNILCSDYIMTHTGYDYPEYVDEEHTKFLVSYFSTLFPNADMKDYILDTICTSMNGEKTEQYFNIHTGKGSNSKTTLNNLIDSMFGNYALRVSPENFTKPKKGTNDTGELYKARGKRRISTNEPESDSDNKLQTPILKGIADENCQTLIARSLYSNPIEFPITFQLDITCNNKPDLSSVDGGIARRVRIIDYKVKFVDNPDPNNVYEAKLDASVMKKMKSTETRNAFIIMIIERWKERVSKFPKIPVPQAIKDASQQYVDDCNVVLGFINQHYEITGKDNDTILSGILYTEFKSEHRASKIDSRKFKQDLENMPGIAWKHTKKGNVFTGLVPKQDSEDE
jgi:hypothetical protein